MLKSSSYLLIIMLGLFSFSSSLADNLETAEKNFAIASESGDSNHSGYRKAYEIWRELAKDGNAEAKYHLSIIYMHGLGGISKDEAKAINLVKEAANDGYPTAQYWLAWQSEPGGLLPESRTSSLQWYKKAAEACHNLAIERLIEIYSTGALGNQKNDDAVDQWRSHQKQCNR